MNYLAHAFLSGQDEDLLVGNFIGDAVKGKAINGYPATIRRGIRLHRAIDEYTDRHPVYRQSRSRLSGRYRHYAGVLTDIFYDHFLARNWQQYHHDPLPVYTHWVYAVLARQAAALPERVNYMLQFMVPQNWLLNYANLTGIQKVLSGMARRTTFESGMENALDELQQYYTELEEEFATFFPQLQTFVQQKLKEKA